MQTKETKVTGKEKNVNISDVDLLEMSEAQLMQMLEKKSIETIVKKTQRKASLYKYPESLKKEEYKKFRRDLRKELTNFASDIIFAKKSKDNVSVTNLIKSFNEFYKKNFIKTDLSLNSITNISAKESPELLENYKLLIQIVKLESAKK